MKLLNTRFLTVLTTLAFLGFFVTAFAKGKPDKCPTWPDCEGGDGGTDPDPVSLDVYWTGDIYESSNRTCEPIHFTPNGNTGNYHCGLSVDNPVEFFLTPQECRQRARAMQICVKYSTSTALSL